MASTITGSRLTLVQDKIRRSPTGYWLSLYRCICGVEKEYHRDNVLRGYTKSCGCLHKERTSEAGRTHGLSKSRVYAIWNTMRARCENQNSHKWESYGARGIRVCERWSRFENFIADMGHPPSAGHSIERINNDGDYCPENCRWATPAEQGRNKRNTVLYTFDGFTGTLRDWADRLGINQNTLCSRLYLYEWPVELAFTTPVRRK